MKFFFFLFTGILFGFWISWPGIIFPNNWKCFVEIIEKSTKDEISLKALLSISPYYLLKAKSIDKTTKLRIIGDACFR